MARQATGAVISHRGKDGRTYRYLRFSAYGKRRFVALGPITAKAATAELRHVLADVERCIWQPAQQQEAPPEPSATPTFEQYANKWWARVQGQLADKTREDYSWRLRRHLLPSFGALALDQITVATVEDYIAAKLKEGERIRVAAAKGEPIVAEITDRNGRTFTRPVQPLSPRSINMTVTLLGAILESALDRELIGRNPARGRGRRVKERKPERSYLDSASQITALLDAAGELDAEAPEVRKHIERRAILTTLIFAGLRISELCSLRWRDVDLAEGWLHVSGSKTDAGVRKVKVRGALRDELAGVRARRANLDADAYVFPTRENAQQDTHNIRARVVAAAVKRADENLIAAGRTPLPSRITPHSLRRTFCSLLCALGEQPGAVKRQMGHTDPTMALRVYEQAMENDEADTAGLRALVDGVQLAEIGRRDPIEAAEASLSDAA